MILAFKPQFVPLIKQGIKLHTIREDKSDRWEKGNTIQFATGVRTKHYNKFHEGICTGIQDVFMTYTYNDLIQISIDGKELFCYSQRLEFAKNDGFETWEAFFNWFYPIIENHPKKQFSGKIIHWSNFRY